MQHFTLHILILQLHICDQLHVEICPGTEDNVADRCDCPGSLFHSNAIFLGLPSSVINFVMQQSINKFSFIQH